MGMKKEQGLILGGQARHSGGYNQEEERNAPGIHCWVTHILSGFHMPSAQQVWGLSLHLSESQTNVSKVSELERTVVLCSLPCWDGETRSEHAWPGVWWGQGMALLQDSLHPHTHSWFALFSCALMYLFFFFFFAPSMCIFVLLMYN